MNIDAIIAECLDDQIRAEFAALFRSITDGDTIAEGAAKAFALGITDIIRARDIAIPILKEKFSMPAIIKPTVPKITLPDGRVLAFGRNAPAPQAQAPLRLAKYMTGGIKMPVVVGVPQNPDWATGAWMGLNDIDGNDTSGDCCFAEIMHLICCVMAATGMKGPFPSKAQAWDLYSRVNVSMGQKPFDPKDPSTDIGGDLPTVMNYLMKNSAITADPTWIADGWLTVDASKPDEIRTSIWLFGGTYKALGLPNEYINPFPAKSGFRWDAAGPPNPQQGHCIGDYGMNAGGSSVETWGMQGTMTAAANAKYCTSAGGGEMHAILWKNWKQVGKQIAPNAIDYAALEADLQAWQAAA